MAAFTEKVVLVAGGASGIGATVARDLKDEGAIVVVGDIRNGDQLLDVTSLTDWQRVIAHIENLHGRLDLMVNCAGVGIWGAIEDLSEADFDAVVRLNLTGTFLGLKAAFPALRRRGGGAIVNIASNLGQRAMPGSAAYAASKAAVIQLSHVAAIEGAADRIRVNTVLPGITRTPMSEAMLQDPGFHAATVGPVPAGRPGEPAEIAAAVLFLLSDAASYVTGTEVIADGGLSANY